jgi:hypothetical protein
VPRFCLVAGAPCVHLYSGKLALKDTQAAPQGAKRAERLGGQGLLVLNLDAHNTTTRVPKATGYNAVLP